MPHSDAGESVTPELDFPSRGGLVVNAVRVDYEPGRYTRGTHRHQAGAYVYVIDGSMIFGLDDRAPVVPKAGASFYEPPGALHLRVAQRQPEAADEPDRVLRARGWPVRDRLRP